MKMRYWAAILISATLLAGTSVSAGVSLNNNTTAETEAIDVSSSMQVEEYTYADTVNRLFKDYIVTNHSTENTSTVIVVRSYDAAGEVIQEKKGTIYCLAPEEEAYIDVNFSKADTIDHVEAEITHDLAQKGYVPVISDLDVQGDINDKSIVLSVTNKSEYSMSGVQALILYLDDAGEVCFHRDLMFWDHNAELKPEKAMYKSTNHEPGYADIRIALTGSSKQSTPKPQADVNPDDITITEYSWGNNYGNNYAYQIVTNNTDKALKIFSNGIAKNADGAMLRTSDNGTNTLAPGETTILEHWFPDSTGCTGFDYAYLYEESTDPTILGQITYESEQTDEGLVVSVTNNGENTGKSMKVFGLFFDADNNLLTAKNADIKNDQSKFAPGETLSGLLKMTDAYDHVEIYVRGSGEATQ